MPRLIGVSYRTFQGERTCQGLRRYPGQHRRMEIHSFVISDVFAAVNIALLLEWLTSVRLLRQRPPANSHHSFWRYTIRVLSSILPKSIFGVRVPRGSILWPILFTVDKWLIGQSAASFGVSFHKYAEDSQLCAINFVSRWTARSNSSVAWTTMCTCSTFTFVHSMTYVDLSPVTLLWH